MKELTIEVEKNVVALFRTNSHCKEEMVGHVRQKYPWLYLWLPHSTLDIFATRKRINDGSA